MSIKEKQDEWVIVERPSWTNKEETINFTPDEAPLKKESIDDVLQQHIDNPDNESGLSLTAIGWVTFSIIIMVLTVIVVGNNYLMQFSPDYLLGVSDTNNITHAKSRLKLLETKEQNLKDALLRIQWDIHIYNTCIETNKLSFDNVNCNEVTLWLSEVESNSYLEY